MRKIGLVVPALKGSGGVQAVARFIKDTALNSGKYELKIISLCMSSDDESSLQITRPTTWLDGVKVKKGIWDDIPFYHVGACLGEFEFQRYKNRKALNELLSDCDIIQVVCGSPAWANTVIGLGKPVSMHVATRAKIERRLKDSNPIGVAGWWRKIMTRVTDHLDNRGFLGVDAIQVMNLWMLEYGRQINNLRVNVDIQYAPPGVNANLFYPLENRLLSNNPYILCVGRLDDPRKNINLLLNAFALLPESLSHIHLITAGSSMPPPEYWALVDAMGLGGRVRHVHRPEINELVSLYQNATVFSLPSDEEGFGMVILEAMACGIPVVSTRSGGPDGIITDEKDGFLVPLNNASVLADRLTRICSDSQLNHRMGQKARLTVESHYSDERAGRAFVDIWDKLSLKAICP